MLACRLNVHEAKTRLSQLLELVEEGETVVIAATVSPWPSLFRRGKRPDFRLASHAKHRWCPSETTGGGL
jgi:hypothetical protein